MYPAEFPGIELPFQTADGSEQQMTALPRVDSDVIAFGCHPLDRFGRDVNDAPVLLNREPVRIFGALFEIFNQRQQTLRQIGLPSLADSALGLLHGPFEAGPVERLQYV